MSSLVIVVDKKKFTLDVIDPGDGAEDPKRVHHCRCAVGMEGFRTPSDEYKTGPRSRTPDWMAPRWAEEPLHPGTIYEYGTQFNPYMHGLKIGRAHV